MSRKELELSSNGSVVKIVPPQVHLEYPAMSAIKVKQDKTVGASPFVDLQPLKQQTFSSLGALSINRSNDTVSGGGQSGLPSLAAAQARSMTRKQNMLATNTSNLLAKKQ